MEYTYTNEETDQDTPPLLNVGKPDQLFCSGFNLCAQSVNLSTTGDRYKTARVIYQPTTWTDFPLPDGIVTSSPDDLVTNNGAETFDAETHIIEARWDITDNLRMNYIYGSFETEETIVSNWTAEEPMLFGTDRPAEYEQQSHELRFTYDAGGPLKFVAGVYDWQSEYDIRLRSWITFVVPGVVLDIPQYTHQETD